MTPSVSVVIPAYNRAHVLPRALASVLEQASEDCEVVIVDDASTDGTEGWLATLDDPRVGVMRLPENRGVNVARNAGIAASRGTWIVPLDSDDELAPGALASIRAAIARTDRQWLLGRCETREGKSMTTDAVAPGPVPYGRYLRGYPQGEWLAVATRAALLAHPFREDLRGGEHITWIAMARDGLGPEVVDKVWRIYDDSGADRLTIKSCNYARLAKVFRADLAAYWREYLRRYPPRLWRTLLRAGYYTLRSIA